MKTKTLTLPSFRCGNVNSQYKCPKCNIEYCSLTCFKDKKHSQCAEEFYKNQIKESLKGEKLSELSDERGKMVKILEKLKNLDQQEDTENEEDLSEDEDEDEIFLNNFKGIKLDDLGVKELEELLGEKHLNNFKELIQSGVTKEWLETAEISSESTWSSWFDKYKPSSFVLNEELPEFVPSILFDQILNIKKLTKKTPSDFLWNNLLEIIVIYSFIYRQFSGKELETKIVIENEVKPILLDFCGSLNKPEQEHEKEHEPDQGADQDQEKAHNTTKNPLFTSALDALEATKSVIFFNSSDHNFVQILSGVLNLLNNPKMIIIMLSDMIKWFKNSKIGSDEFYAEKKLIFLISWFNTELEQSKKSVENILKILSNIVEQFKDIQEETET